MIRQSLVVTALILILYTAFIHFYGPAISRTAQTTAQRNLVKAEEYMYEASSRYDTLIVGSSMSERILTDSLNAHSYNLSFSGLSSLDGLYLIAHSGHAPKMLFVEINSIARRDPPQLDLTQFTDSTQHCLKQWLPFLRTKYQPVGVAKALLRDWQHGRNAIVIPESALRQDTALLNKTVTQLQAPMHVAPLAAHMNESFAKARTYLDALRRQGTTVVLFEMPIDVRLEQLAAPQAIRQYAQRYFPAPDYQHIDLPNGAFQTSDGIHLLYNESARYTRYLRQESALLANRGATHTAFIE